MSDRKYPFIPRPDNDPSRLADLRKQGRDADMLPLAHPFTTKEREAAASPGMSAAALERPMAEATPPPKSPIPPWLVRTGQAVALLSGALLTALPAVAAFLTLPAWAPVVLIALGCAGAVVAGLDLPSPTAGKPILTGAALTVVTALIPVVVRFAESMPEGFVKQAVLAIIIVLGYLAGIAVNTRKAA
jgi:hypothetical protein